MPHITNLIKSLVCIRLRLIELEKIKSAIKLGFMRFGFHLFLSTACCRKISFKSLVSQPRVREGYAIVSRKRLVTTALRKIYINQ